MKKYYGMVIDKGNSDAMNNLGYYYDDVEKNYDEAKKYYLMAIDKGNSVTMNNLGYY
jgi:TPR repeat protein